MQTVFVIVGRSVRRAEAEIVDGVAEVRRPPYDVKRFAKWYRKESHARGVLTKLKAHAK